MGDVIYIADYKKRKRERTFPTFNAELDRLWIVITVWTPYNFALERQVNDNWMEMFFYPDEDW